MPVVAPMYLILMAAGAAEAAAFSGMLLAEADPLKVEMGAVWGNAGYRMAMIAGALGGMFFALLWTWEDKARRMSAKIFAQPLLAMAFTPYLVEHFNLGLNIETILAVSFAIGAAGTSVLHVVIPFVTDTIWPIIGKKFQKKAEDL